MDFLDYFFPLFLLLVMGGGPLFLMYKSGLMDRENLRDTFSLRRSDKPGKKRNANPNSPPEHP